VIAGATGYIGKSTVRESVRQGYHTVALVRDIKKVQTPEGQRLYDKCFDGAEVVECDVSDLIQLVKVRGTPCTGFMVWLPSILWLASCTLTTLVYLVHGSFPRFGCGSQIGERLWRKLSNSRDALMQLFLALHPGPESSEKLSPLTTRLP
jgi:NmrA-like family